MSAAALVAKRFRRAPARNLRSFTKRAGAAPRLELGPPATALRLFGAIGCSTLGRDGVCAMRRIVERQLSQVGAGTGCEEAEFEFADSAPSQRNRRFILIMSPAAATPSSSLCRRQSPLSAVGRLEPSGRRLANRRIADISCLVQSRVFCMCQLMPACQLTLSYPQVGKR